MQMQQLALNIPKEQKKRKWNLETEDPEQQSHYSTTKDRETSKDSVLMLTVVSPLCGV